MPATTASLPQAQTLRQQYPIPSDEAAQPHGSARFVIRFDRGSGERPELKGAFLRWQAGFLRVCAAIGDAERYDLPHVARDLATRAERAFPGARLSVVPVLA